MSKSPKQDFSDYQPDPAVAELIARADGNAINGLGNAALEPPKPIMWHQAVPIAHGELQKWFFENGATTGARQKMQETMMFTNSMPPDDVSARPDWSPSDWTQNIKQAALELEADQVGITRMRPDWIFEAVRHQMI